jgi:beta-glucanase (GH16 family)
VLPEGWTLANHNVVKYSADGAEFSINKRREAPYIWTSFYILFGRVEVVMKAANGTGIVSSAVLMSDSQDKIDWEWSGNNFANPSGKVQTNYFGKGITGNYDRGTQPFMDSPQTKFHTYGFDWSPIELTWSIDGQIIRTPKVTDGNTADHQYPQSPSKFHLGVWCAGDPDGHPDTVS